jgi:hypothetical protein
MAFFFHSRSHEAFPAGYPIRIFEATNDKVRKKKTDERLSCNGGYSCDEEVTQQYHHDVFSMPKVPWAFRAATTV